MRPGQERQPDAVHVLLQGRRHNHLRRLVQSCVDDFEPGIAQGPCDDLGAAIVAVQADFSDQEPDLPPALHHKCTRPS